MLPTIKATLHSKPPDKDGRRLVIIRVTFQRKVFNKSTQLKATEKEFDGLFKPSAENSAYKNNILKKQIARYEQEFLRMLDTDTLTLENVTAFLSDKPDQNKLSDVLRRAIDKSSGNVSFYTSKCWRSVARKITAFQDPPTHQVNARFAHEYEQYCRSKGNQHNTVVKNLVTLSALLQKAKTLGLIKASPLQDYKPPRENPTQRAYLTAEQVERLERFAEETEVEGYRNAARWYLLGVYCGLRYADLAKWDEARMVKGNKLYFTDSKTQTPQYVPIYAKLEKAIAEVRGVPLYANQVCNNYFKLIAAATGLPRFSFHSSRHTFAVLYLERGGSVEVLQKLMGHSKINTTQIYGRITNKRIDDETEKVFGDIYYVVAANGLETCKYINADKEDKNNLLLVARNERISPSPIPKTMITKLYKVRGILRGY